ncbi:Cell cycle checkpoint protein [Drechslerella dactyloides]|uniref:Cell cycle checkpoint protein n=1 Tax=Drechslerella dactyloides TaxID=74499 RepID=A0AAD6IU23_DREDA|nr:Cell cycle checkpoint protein [Drechslerella dactyloides]
MARPRKIRIISSDEDDDEPAGTRAAATAPHKSDAETTSTRRISTRSTRSTSTSKPKGTLNGSASTSRATPSATTAQTTAAASKSARTSRPKASATVTSPRKTSKLPASQATKQTPSISSFFSKATHTQPPRKPKRGISQLSEQLHEDEDIDSIESSSDDDNRRRNVRKVVVPIISSEPDELPRKLPTPPSNICPTKPSKARLNASNPAHEAIELQTWADKYAPTSTAELAVHKRKIDDVRTWLADVFASASSKRLLVLSGPSGSGKTATITALAKEMDFDVLKWENPSQYDSSADGIYESLNAKFEEFMGRGTGYGALTLVTSASSNALAKKAEKPRDPNRRQVILLEDLPNIFSSSAAGSSAMMSFRGAVHEFLATPQDDVLPSPCILIISENLTTQSNSSSITPHRLLGPQLLNHRRTTSIPFNKVAATIMQKALEKVIDLEARRTGTERPSAAVLVGVGACGDIRSAINTLEFIMIGKSAGLSRREVPPRGKKGKGRGTQTRVEASESERLTLELITQRESSLGIFHAVGKVVWNKRFDPSDPRIQPPEILPDPPPDLATFARPPSLVDITTLIDTAGVDLETFISGVHENYLPSCGGDSFIEQFEACIEHLSDADLLSSFISPGSRNQVEDNMRQGELSFQVAVRGTLLGLPTKVKRESSRGGTGSSGTMYYPMSQRLWRDKEVIEGLVGIFVASGLRDFGNEKIAGGMAELDALLEYLPYAHRITKGKLRRVGGLRTPAMKNLEKVVLYRGVGDQSEAVPDGPDEEEEVENGEEDEMGNVKVRRKVRRQKEEAGGQYGGRFRRRKDGGVGIVGIGEGDQRGEGVEDSLEGLVLADDDIEDSP